MDESDYQGDYRDRNKREKVKQLEPKLVSFDVFDTVILRKVATSTGIFSIMQQRLEKSPGTYPLRLIRQLVVERIDAEKVCRQHAAKAGRDEITLEEIYAELAERYFLDVHQKDALIQLEIEQELMQVVAVPQIVQRLCRYAESGKRVLLISDTYLPLNIVQQMLNKADPQILNHATLYLSSQEGVVKRDGKMFRHVLENESIPARDMLHVGHNLNSDVHVPRRLGIAVEQFSEARLATWERAPREFAQSELGSSLECCWQLAAGMCRAVRLVQSDFRYVVGYGVAGPVLLPFVLWILRQSRQFVSQGRLYFIARDGQILDELSAVLQHRIGIQTPQRRYLYGSRQAFNLPSMTSIGDRELNWIFKTYHELTLQKMAARVGLNPEEIRTCIANRTKLPASDTARLSAEHLQVLKIELAKEGSLRTAVLESAKTQRHLLIDYFKQEGLLDDDAPQLVDIGWSGRIQDSVYAIVNQGCNKPLIGYFFGLMVRTRFVGMRNRKYGYLGEPHGSSEDREVCGLLATFLEAFTSADHGSVVGYRRNESGVVIPITDDQHVAVLGWGLKPFRDGLLQFARDIPLELIEPETWESYGKLVSYRLAQQLRREVPDQQLVECLGTFPFTPEQDGIGLMEMAPRSTTLDILRFYFDPRISRSSITLWPQGSYVRSRSPLRIMLHPRLLNFIAAMLPGGRYDISARIRQGLRAVAKLLRR